MHVPRAKTKGCQFSNNYDDSGNYWSDYAETSHACKHPAGDVFPCVTVGCCCMCARARQQSFQISRTAEPIALKLGILMGTG